MHLQPIEVAIKFTVISFSTLGAFGGIDKLIHLCLRDVGATRYFDWRACEDSMGRQWSTGGVWDADGGDRAEFEPTLINFCRNNWKPIRDVAKDLAMKMAGCVSRPEDGSTMSDMTFLLQCCGPSTRGGPADGPKSAGLSESELVKMARRPLLAARAEHALRFDCEVDNCPATLTEIVVPAVTEEDVNKRSNAIMKFVETPRCCLDDTYGEILQPEFIAAVGNSGVSSFQRTAND